MADHEDGDVEVDLDIAAAAGGTGTQLDVDLAAALATLSVKELKARLKASDVQPEAVAGCVEKGELVALLVNAGSADGDDAISAPGLARGGSSLLKSMFGAAGALSAEHEMKVMAMGVSELKAHLSAMGVDYSKVTEKEELQQLALQGKQHVREVAGQDDVGEHLLEC